MDPTDSSLLAALERGLPVTREPFAEIGRTLGIPESEVLDRLHRLKNEGVIRRFRARIDQRKVGILANALVAWRVPGHLSEEAGTSLSRFPGVTHCYERRPVPGRWDYTHYTVHHGCSREAVEAEVAKLAEVAGLNEYIVMFSTEELKRVPAVRVRENGGDLQ
ncbi:MAG: siroheme decarboxylase subunit beta [Methanoregulaceae archaeon]